MKKSFVVVGICLFLMFSVVVSVQAAVSGSVLRETAEYILKKFGKGVAGGTIEEVTEATEKMLVKYGDDVLPLLREAGHSGFNALREAGEEAPKVIKLYAKRGNDAIWVMSENRKLALFLKYGDNAAAALIKHPSIADDVIEKFGTDAATALNAVSRQNAQRFGMLATEGFFTSTPQSAGLINIIGKHGDSAMNFIWRNKGALTVTAVLLKFYTDPQSFISGTNILTEPVINSVANNTNWTVVISIILIIILIMLTIKYRRVFFN